MKQRGMHQLPHLLVEAAVKRALEEDLGLGGDITTNSIFNQDTQGTATIRARQAGILAGQTFANHTLQQLEPSTKISWQKEDGNALAPGDDIAMINGSITTLLTGERTALNFLGHLSGIASLTACYVAEITGTNAKIIDTRKTTPGLRFAEKYAVTLGGGQNHRMRLDDAVLIKDNHIAFAGSIKNAITQAHANAGHMVKIEVEVDTLSQLDQALNEKIDVVLLDNFTIPDLEIAVRKAKEKTGGACKTEASGGINLETVRQVAETGVDYISVGALTHSAPTLDLGLDIDIAAA